MSDPSSSRKPRGWLTLYAMAFVIMLVAGVLLGVAARDFLDNITVLWISSGLSALAILLAITAVLAPKRR